MTTHSSILTWRIPWTEEPGRLQSIGSQRVRHNWSTWAQHTHKHTYTHTHTHTYIYITGRIYFLFNLLHFSKNSQLWLCCCCLVTKSFSTLLLSHGPQHMRLLCPLLSPGVCSNTCSLSWWCYPTISSSYDCSVMYISSWSVFKKKDKLLLSPVTHVIVVVSVLWLCEGSNLLVWLLL